VRVVALTERFWSKVDKTDTCWLWTAGVNASGYGLFHTGRRPNGSKIAALAHRVAYQAEYGPTDSQLDHICEVRLCVRPDHLQPIDAAVHGQKSAATRYGQDAFENWRAGLCRWGHSKSERRPGELICRTCRAAASSRGAAKAKAARRAARESCSV
jgi:hypothetical protein